MLLHYKGGIASGGVARGGIERDGIERGRMARKGDEATVTYPN